MNASRGVKRKRGPAKSLQQKVGISLEPPSRRPSLKIAFDLRPNSFLNKFFPVNSCADMFVRKESVLNLATKAS